MPTLGTTGSAPSKGSVTAALAGPGDYYAQLAQDPGRIAQAYATEAEVGSLPGYFTAGSSVDNGALPPGHKGWLWDTETGGGYAGGGYGGGGSGAGGTTGGAGGGTGGGYVGGYELPGSAAAAQSLRDLQMGATGGLQSLMSRDSSAQRKKMEDAIYASSARGIDTAADRARQVMLEGTFAHGVGSSSILTELAGRQQQEHSDALAQAAREAFMQAGNEDRAELASLLGLNQGAFNAATAGLQGEANVALTNLARMQQESQFSRNLGFQGSENALNRAQQASQFGQSLGLSQQQLAQQNSQFGQNLGLNYAQLGQQNSQFGQSLGLQQQQLAQQNAQFGQNLGFNYAQLGQQNSQFGQSLGQQNAQFNQNLGFQGTQNDAQRELARFLAQQQQTFQGTQNQNQQIWAGGQNQLNRDAQLAQLLLQLQAADQRQQDAQGGAALGAGLTGAGQLLSALLANWGRS